MRLADELDGSERMNQPDGYVFALWEPGATNPFYEHAGCEDVDAVVREVRRARARAEMQSRVIASMTIVPYWFGEGR